MFFFFFLNGTHTKNAIILKFERNGFNIQECVSIQECVNIQECVQKMQMKGQTFRPWSVGWSDCFEGTVWSGYTVCPDTSVRNEQSDLGLQCLSRHVCQKWAVWSGSTLFVQTRLSEMSSLIWVYTVCPDPSVRKEQSDLGLHCLSRPVCQKGAVWSGSALFVQTCLSERSSLIWVYTFCADPSIRKEQSDLGLHCLSRPVCQKGAVWSGSALFVQTRLSERSSLIWVYTVCPDPSVRKEQSNQGLHCLSRPVCQKGAVWSGSALFVQTRLSECLGSIQLSKWH